MKSVLTSLASALTLASLASAPVFAEGPDTIRDSLGKVLPGFAPTNIQPSAVEGLYAVEIGPQVMFVTADGRFLIDGAIVDLETREDISEQVKAGARLRSLEAVGEDQMVIFAAPDEKHQITVFTDIDCGYCRKLHDQVADYNDLGISVRYLFYPRAGEGSKAYDKAVGVWCNEDRNATLTEAKEGVDVSGQTCVNPVNAHYELGQMMGIRGTPAIITDSGEMIPGYVEPARLGAMLEQSGG